MGENRVTVLIGSGINLDFTNLSTNDLTNCVLGPSEHPSPEEMKELDDRCAQKYNIFDFLSKA